MAAGEYVINWTYPQGKDSFTIQPNEINGPGQIKVNTPLMLYGRFTVNYGQLIAQNFAHLLENFASPSEPIGATSGMLWFDTTVSPGVLKVRNSANTSWIIVGTGASGNTGGAGGSPGSPPSAGNFTATAGSNYFINTTTAAITVTLPATPSVGDVIGFTDVAGTFDVNNLTINGNSKLIMSDASPLISDVKYSAFRLGFSGDTFGWRIVP